MYHPHEADDFDNMEDDEKDTGIDGKDWCPLGRGVEISVCAIIVLATVGITIASESWNTLGIEICLLIGPILLWLDESKQI